MFLTDINKNIHIEVWICLRNTKTEINTTLSRIAQWENRKNIFLTGHIDHLNLYTALQPIFSIAHKRIAGYEALLSVKDAARNRISPKNPGLDRQLPLLGLTLKHTPYKISVHLCSTFVF